MDCPCRTPIIFSHMHVCTLGRGDPKYVPGGILLYYHTCMHVHAGEVVPRCIPGGLLFYLHTYNDTHYGQVVPRCILEDASWTLKMHLLY